MLLITVYTIISQEENLENFREILAASYPFQTSAR
jgi:hypothetical protein